MKGKLILGIFIFMVMSMQAVQAVTLNSGECITPGNVTYCAVTCTPIDEDSCSDLIEEGIDNRTKYLEENCFEMENLFNSIKYARDNITKTINNTFATLGPGFLDDLALYKNKSAKYENLYTECDLDLKTYGVLQCKENTTKLQSEVEKYKKLYYDISSEIKNGDPERNLPACVEQMQIAQGQMWYGWIGGILIGAGIMWWLRVRKKTSSVDKTREGIYTEGEMPRTTRKEELGMIDWAREKVKLQSKGKK